uniref:MADS-box domain-containing protein n=1 Tax=Kalanchoe fedtschenkoi TaxID=63787 RepID=A0A7N0U5J6_KALFE
MGTGRKRIEIKPIDDTARRRVTFTKRRQGLFKKMDKLCTLTGCTAAAIVFSTAGRPYTFGDLSLLDAFTGSMISSGGEGGSSVSYSRQDDHGGCFYLGIGEVSEPDGFKGSGGDGGCSTSYGSEVGGGNDHGGVNLGFGEIEGVNGLDGLLEEMSSLLEMRRQVVERLNRHVEGFDDHLLLTSPLSTVEVDLPPPPLMAADVTHSDDAIFR